MDHARCASCRGPLPSPSGRGPSRRYCSGRCRQAALRQRRAGVRAARDRDDDLTTDPDPGAPVSSPMADPADSLTALIFDLRGSAGALQRLAPQLPATLGVRAEYLAADVAASVRRWFTGG